MADEQVVANNPLFVDQLGDVRCPYDFPWFRHGRCWQYRYDQQYDDPDIEPNSAPLEEKE